MKLPSIFGFHHDTETDTETELDMVSQEQHLAESLMFANEQYRAGEPVMGDEEYDAQQAYLAELNPEHPLLTTVEPEALKGQTYVHTSPMLSTNKAYLADDVDAWLNKIAQAGASCGDSDPIIRATAKLDGVACKFIPSPLTLATRGDGNQGNVVTHLLDMGMKIHGDTANQAVGEIVMPKAYFEQHLSENYAHPRNVVAGIVNADSHSEDALNALKNGGIHLVLYRDMPAVELPLSEFREAWEEVEAHLRECDYPIDGVVFEAKSASIKAAMGANSHHHHWQLAKKIKAAAKQTTVTDVTYQLGRTGLLTPVVHIEPVDLDGAMTSKVTGHHVGNIINKQIGIGAKVEVLRAGEVIPYLANVITPATELNVPSCCPECGSEVEMREDFLYCIGDECTGSDEAKIIHHFSILNALLFGKVTVGKLVAAGFNSVESVYQMTKADFVEAGLGEGQAQNLLNEIARIKAEPMPDYLLVASLGVSKLGRGSAKKLLAQYRIEEVANVTAEQLQAIDGFGEVSATIVTRKLNQNALLAFLLAQGFDIEHTQDKANAVASDSTSPVAGKSVVFTGKCTLSRGEMSDYAQSLGCVVQDRVGKDTDYLVCGENVGATKMEAAKKKGATVLSEGEFRELASQAQEIVTVEFDSPATEKEVVATPLASEKSAVTYESVPTQEENEMTNTASVTQPSFAAAEGQLLNLDPRTLKDPEWGNPRSTISDADYNALLESVKAKGVHTPVFIRPVGDGYELVAGFTRRRAAIDAGLASIPCLSRVMDDKTAYELAVSENVDRTNMSALDEAASLKEIVKRHNGDIQAASKEMGWSRAKFDRAIQLLRSSDYVRSLVGKKQENGFTLSVAHAARLSSLPETLQDKLVAAVISEKMSVSVLGEKISKVVKRPLSAATFCKKECDRCEFNSEIQTSMFADDEGDANCTNPTCFAKKTTEHYEIQVKELEKDYGKIVLLSTVENPVTVDAKMVGDDQYTNGCLSCDKHCAILADKGLKQNSIMENQCLDSECASGHAEALRQAVANAAKAETAVSQQGSETPAPKAAKATKPSAPKAQASLPKRLIMESQTALRDVGKELLMQHPSYQLAVTLSALKTQAESAHRMEDGVITLMQHSPEELQGMIVDTIAALTHNVQREGLNFERTVIRAAQKNCTGFKDEAVRQWMPTKDRLASMTKAIRQQALEQSGFANAFKAEKGEAAYTALLNKKTDDAVSEILGFTFDWTGYAPDYYIAAVTTQKYNF